MTDIDRVLREDADRWQHAVDSGARPAVSRIEGAPAHRTLLLVASAVVVLLAILGTTLAVASHRDHPEALSRPTVVHGGPPGANSVALRGVTWSGPNSSGTVVFGAGTVHLTVGCDRGLRTLIVRGRVLRIGKPVGQQIVCSQVDVPGSRPEESRFDQVVHQGRLHWSISGHTLTLTPRRGMPLRLTTNGVPAPASTDRHRCEQLTGHPNAAGTRVRFTHVEHPGPHTRCSDVAGSKHHR